MHEVSRFAHKDHPYITFDESPIGIWVCTESYDVHRDVLQPKLRQYLDPQRIVEESSIKRGCWSWIKYKAKDGTITDIQFKSYDQGREKFQGAGKQLISFDEEPPRDIWEECTVREEAGRELKIILSMTPVNGMTWIYEEIYLNTNNPDIHVVTASWKDNPWLTEEQKARMGRGLTPEARQVREEGKFIRITGLVCPWFDRSAHVQQITFNPEWTLYRAIDFGFSQPCCVLWIGVDYDDNWYVYDGIYQSGLTNPQLKDAIIRKDAQRYITNCWGDCAAMSDIQELNDMGVNVLPVEKTSGDSKESWDEYRARLLMEHGTIGRNGRPKIIIGSNLVRYDEKLGREVNWMVAELEKLRWDERLIDGQKTQQSRWGDQAKHGIDSITYFAHEYRREHGFAETTKLPRINTDETPSWHQPIIPMTNDDPYET